MRRYPASSAARALVESDFENLPMMQLAYYIIVGVLSV